MKLTRLTLIGTVLLIVSTTIAQSVIQMPIPSFAQHIIMLTANALHLISLVFKNSDPEVQTEQTTETNPQYMVELPHTYSMVAPQQEGPYTNPQPTPYIQPNIQPNNPIDVENK